MTKRDLPSVLFVDFKRASNSYLLGNYYDAHSLMNIFKSKAKKYYLKLKEEIKIPYSNTAIIIVIHSESNILEFQDCLDSISDKNYNNSIIIINNGANESLITDIKINRLNLTIINTNCNIYPSEARNIGGIIANSEWLYFIDDDAILTTGIESIAKIQNKEIFAARGVVVAKDNNKTIPNHYSPSDREQPYELNIEGNLLIKKSLFLAVGGFDPLMFAHEGKDLTKKCHLLVDKEKIIYSPTIEIKHNPSEKTKLIKKVKRNMDSIKYMEFKNDNNLELLNMLIIIFCENNVIGLENKIDKIIREYRMYKVDIILITKFAHDICNALKSSKLITKVKIFPESFIANNYISNLGYSIACVTCFESNNRFEMTKIKISESLKNNNIQKIDVHTLISWLDKFGIEKNSNSSVINEMINDFKQNRFKYYQLPIMKRAFSKSCLIQEVLFISFYTTDKYYTDCSVSLKDNLDTLGISHEIVPFEIPKNITWPEICRKKVNFYYHLFEKNKLKYKKIIWIDVDCNINYLPSFILDFDFDFMAFRRGFQNSKHAERILTRHWEPCFFVFKTNNTCRDFLKYASELESKLPNIKATDDYFFEEAWRELGSTMNVFEIPGEMSTRGNNSEVPIIKRKINNIFFNFGESGKVQEYKGKVIQHEIASKQINTKLPINLKANFMELIKIGKENKNLLCESSHTFGKGFNENERELVKSIYNYENGGDLIKLNWWIRPAPGNMGDWLSPYIISKLTGNSVCYTDINNSKLISLGSIGKFISYHHTVWGTGISTIETNINKNARFLAVRGPYTAKAIKKSGGNPPELFGDPAILLPLIYQPKKIITKSNYGLVRHFVHQNCDLKISEGITDLNILLSSPKDIENFIDQLVSFKAVVTTSLHVLILCISYNIPCRLIKIDETEIGVHGDGIKYNDFYEGVGLISKKHVYFGNSITINSIESAVENDKIDLNYIVNLKNILINDFIENRGLYV